MSGILPGFGSRGGRSGSGAAVSGAGHVKQIGDPFDPTLQVLVARPFVARGAQRMEFPDGVQGPTTWWGFDTGGRLMKAEDVPGNVLTDIELVYKEGSFDLAAMCSEGKDRFFIDRLVFWGASVPPTTLRASLWSDKDRTGTELFPDTVDLTGQLPNHDSVFIYPLVLPLAVRFARLHWKVTTPQDITINIAAFGGVLNDIPGVL